MGKTHVDPISYNIQTIFTSIRYFVYLSKSYLHINCKILKATLLNDEFIITENNLYFLSTEDISLLKHLY